jgi:hypothetical protein
MEETGRSGGEAKATAGEPLVRYRLFLCLLIAFVFALERFIVIQKPYALARLLGVGDLTLVKKWLGIGVSFLFVGVLVEYAWAFLPRLARRRVRWRVPERSYAFYERAFYVVASLFLFGDLQGWLLRGLLPPFPSPTLGEALAWMAVWAAVFATSSRLRARVDVDLVRFVFLILLTRSLMIAYVRYEAIYADMLRTIDRSLGLLLAGEFPYIDEPPPAMPYWPLTFLQYLPPRLLGWDLRTTNVVVDLATVLVALRLGIDRRDDPRRTINARLSLPLLLLFRTWTGYSSDTQFSLSVFFAALFARCVSSRGGLAQAVALGGAVAANQTFGIFGPFVLPFWIRRFGPRRAAVLTLASLSTCLVFLAPFLIWNPREFVRVTLLALAPFPVSFLAGHFSMRPLVEGLFPHAVACAAALTVAVVIGLNAVHSDRRRVAATIAVGYCVVLMLLHRTFSHYYLPVIAMIVCVDYEAPATAEDEKAPGERRGLQAQRASE